jgi:hypothetical protein
MKTSAYLVTPPTVFMATSGLSFTLVTRNPKWIESTQELIEADFQGTNLVFYSTYEDKDDSNWPWLYQQGMISDFILVDLASASDFDICVFLPFVRERKVFWIIDEDLVDNNMMALLNLHSASTSENIEDFLEIIKSGL